MCSDSVATLCMTIISKSCQPVNARMGDQRGQAAIRPTGPATPPRHRSARSATLLLGAAWCLWHLPSFFYNYPGLTLFGLLAFVVSLMSGAVVLTWLYNSTGGSILAAALWHGTFNAATASGEGPMPALVSAFVILAAVVIGRWAGPEALPRSGKHTI